MGGTRNSCYSSNSAMASTTGGNGTRTSHLGLKDRPKSGINHSAKIIRNCNSSPMNGRFCGCPGRCCSCAVRWLASERHPKMTALWRLLARSLARPSRITAFSRNSVTGGWELSIKPRTPGFTASSRAQVLAEEVARDPQVLARIVSRYRSSPQEPWRPRDLLRRAKTVCAGP
jgi:hypothetical protein